MKTKLTWLLIVLGIAASLGMNKIKNANKIETNSGSNIKNASHREPIGGFVSEEH